MSINEAEELVKLFDRDLSKLQTEIELFIDERNLWTTKGSIKNTAGNLCLHLVGNLNTYIGKNLGATGYLRDRNAEFSLKNVSREELIKKVVETKDVVTSVLSGLKPADLANRYQENVLGYEMTTGYFLIHLLGHLSYHLGQINYIRRMQE